MQHNRAFDQMIHNQMSKYWGWLSPVTGYLAFADWYLHMAISPQQVSNLLWNATQKTLDFLSFQQQFFINSEDGAKTKAQAAIKDRRFQNELWEQFPYNIYARGFILQEQLWDDATTGNWGVNKHNLNLVNFVGKQMLDMFAPTNFFATNPEIISKTQEKSGSNLVAGYQNLLEDVKRQIEKTPAAGTEKYQVGVNVAVTPGKVVYRNQLIELIQYRPSTQTVYSEPILIVPAWIMKYYILDLSQTNSLVKYLVDQGHTVFMISWKNPSAADQNLTINDYVELGVMSALKVVNSILPGKKVHSVGYCIGGTLLMIAAAAMAGKADDRLKTITMFAAQIDFRDAGEIQLFIDESQVSHLEDVMAETGYLDGSNMGGAFTMLRSVDMVWSKMINNYFMGDNRSLNDLMAWNADTTRMPYKMHSEYLRSLFMNNDLVEGNFAVNGKKVSLLDIKVPMFGVSTITDHVAPCVSAYKIHQFVNTDITFALTSGGHNAGIVSEPGHAGRKFQILLHKQNEPYISLEQWKTKAPSFEGSWWPSWHQWLAKNSSERVSPPSMGNKAAGYNPICDAPGTYVLIKGDK